jgi:hypothetical protein
MCDNYLISECHWAIPITFVGYPRTWQDAKESRDAGRHDTNYSAPANPFPDMDPCESDELVGLVYPDPTTRTLVQTK